MIQARFDTNEHGQYLGTATIIYAKASAALRAIDEYNGASLDNRMMKVQYVDENTRPSVSPTKNFKNPGHQGAQQRSQERRERSLKPRNNRGRIQKNRDTPMREERAERRPLLGDNDKQSR